VPLSRRFLALSVLAVACASTLAAPARSAGAAELSAELAERVAPLLPAVVAIQTIAQTPNGRMFFSGSGFIIEPSGIIVTNRHVIKGADEIAVDVPRFPPLEAHVLYVSDRIDLALLKVDAGVALPVVKLGDSDTVRIGDRVILVGNPLGIGESVSQGVVSALNRDIRETPYDNFIQTDAALNHGNSGGAMFNMQGEVIGISTGLYSSPGNTGSIGLGFAMPINDAHFIIDQYLKTGHVHGGWVGVDAQALTPELAAAFGVRESRGAVVTFVDEKGPAAGKLRVGDVVLRVGEQDASDMRAVARLIASRQSGTILPVVLVRDGVARTVEVPVAEIYNDSKRAMAMTGRMRDDGMVMATPGNPGMVFAELSDATRAKFGLAPEAKGVVVTEVAPNSAAARANIAAGDVIERVRDVPVSTPHELQLLLDATAHEQRHYAALLILGQKGRRWVPFPIAPDH
jgi:serine protease Do